MKHSLLVVQSKKKNVLRKIACIGLGITTIFSMMPLGVHALSRNDETYKQEGKVIEEIYPGEVFTTGDYVVKGNIKVVQNNPGGNGIEIRGDVKFIIEKNSSIEITAGNAEGTIGGGAGIYLSSGNIFTLEGEGRLYVKGGDGAKGQSGEPGEPGEAKFFGATIMDKPGKTGSGGAGGGGGGAAIGTSGGNGGHPGAGIKGDWVIAVPGSASDAENGPDGGKGGKSEEFGALVLHGDVDLKLKGGESFKDNAKAGKPGRDLRFQHPYSKYFDLTCEASGGAGGGAGGNGFSGANIGCGGSGGGAGGSGGGGLCNGRTRPPVPPQPYETVNGGVGGQGIGNGSLDKSNKGGRSGFVFGGPKTGKGGDGGLPTPIIASGVVYDAGKYESVLPRVQAKTDYDGKESPKKRIVIDSDCEVEMKSGNVFPYTGEPIEPEVMVIDKRTEVEIPRESYKVTYMDNIEVGEAVVSAKGVNVGDKNIPMIVSEDDFDMCGNTKAFFTIIKW